MCNLEWVSQKRFLRWYILFLLLKKLSTVVSLVFMVHKSFLQCFIFHTLSSKSKLRWVNFVIISYTAVGFIFMASNYSSFFVRYKDRYNRKADSKLKNSFFRFVLIFVLFGSQVGCCRVLPVMVVAFYIFRTFCLRKRVNWRI